MSKDRSEKDREYIHNALRDYFVDFKKQLSFLYKGSEYYMVCEMDTCSTSLRPVMPEKYLDTMLRTILNHAKNGFDQDVDMFIELMRKECKLAMYSLKPRTFTCTRCWKEEVVSYRENILWFGLEDHFIELEGFVELLRDNLENGNTETD